MANAATLEATVTRVLIGRHPLIPLAEKQASPDGHYLVSTAVEEVHATLEGLAGDRHAGFTRHADARAPQYPRGTEIHNSRQVSLVAEEELAEIAANMGVPVIKPEWIGANIVLRGIPHLSLLPPMTRVYFPELTAIALEGENHPCLFPGKAIQIQYPNRPGIGKQFPKAAYHLRGVVGWVERAGIIRTGDTDPHGRYGARRGTGAGAVSRAGTGGAIGSPKHQSMRVMRWNVAMPLARR